MKYTLDGQETERLKFRLLTNDDFNKWSEIFKDNEVSIVLGMVKIGTLKEQCDKWKSGQYLLNIN